MAHGESETNQEAVAGKQLLGQLNKVFPSGAQAAQKGAQHEEFVKNIYGLMKRSEFSKDAKVKKRGTAGDDAAHTLAAHAIAEYARRGGDAGELIAQLEQRKSDRHAALFDEADTDGGLALVEKRMSGEYGAFGAIYGQAKNLVDHRIATTNEPGAKEKLITASKGLEHVRELALAGAEQPLARATLFSHAALSSAANKKVHSAFGQKVHPETSEEQASEKKQPSVEDKWIESLFELATSDTQESRVRAAHMLAEHVLRHGDGDDIATTLTKKLTIKNVQDLKETEADKLGHAVRTPVEQQLVSRYENLADTLQGARDALQGEKDTNGELVKLRKFQAAALYGAKGPLAHLATHGPTQTKTRAKFEFDLDEAKTESKSAERAAQLALDAFDAVAELRKQPGMEDAMGRDGKVALNAGKGAALVAGGGRSDGDAKYATKFPSGK